MLATRETRDHEVGFPLLLGANATVHAWQDKAFTVPANEPPILLWQSDSGSHGNFPCHGSVSLGQLGILMNGFTCEAKEGVDTL